MSPVRSTASRVSTPSAEVQGLALVLDEHEEGATVGTVKLVLNRHMPTDFEGACHALLYAEAPAISETG